VKREKKICLISQLNKRESFFLSFFCLINFVQN
jgi:hypothetical protein